MKKLSVEYVKQGITSIAFMLLISLCLPVYAQEKTPLKPPTLQSFWGYYKAGTHSLESVHSMIDTALWVIDDQKQYYQLRSFRINYFSFDQYEDEATGKIKNTRNLVSKEFRETNMLSDLWKKSIHESLKPKDEILIDLISVKDKQGRIFYAPDIKITVR